MSDPVLPLLESLRAHARRAPGERAVAGASGEVNRGELCERIEGVAEALKERGVRPGDRVALLAQNGVEWVAAYFGIHAAGAVAVPLDAQASRASIDKVLELARPALLLTARELEGASVPSVDLRAVSERRASWTDARPPQLDAPADLLFTTGTTGRPKGVLLSHGSLAHAAKNIAAFLEQREDDVELVPLPLSHSFGLGRIRCMARVGNCVVLENGLTDPRGFVERLVSSRATGFALVPAGLAMLNKLTRDALGRAKDQLRYVEIGSMALSRELREWLTALLPNTRLCHHYGLTEASRAAFVELHSAAAEAGSIGAPSPNVRITVRDEAGRDVAPGTEGELWVFGGMVMQGYFEQPELTAAALQGGAVRTGDRGLVDAEGRLFLRGRTSDIINVGGLKVAPEEVEALLRAFPGIEDAACVGVPDPRGIFGERVKAYVVTSGELPRDELTHWLGSQGLESHKLPVEVENIQAIPRTPSGKILRRVLRERAGRSEDTKN